MIKVTIAAEGEPDEVEAFLKRHNFGSISQEGGASKDLRESSSILTEPREVILPKLWAKMGTAEGRQILGQLAKHPASYHWEQLDADLGITWRQRNGRLSSIKFALNKLGLPEEASPVIRDWGKDDLHYRMTEEDAAIIRKLAEQEGF